MTPPPALLRAYAARDRAYVLFKPDDMPDGEWWFVREALAFARQACEKAAQPDAPRQAVSV